MIVERMFAMKRLPSLLLTLFLLTGGAATLRHNQPASADGAIVFPGHGHHQAFAHARPPVSDKDGRPKESATSQPEESVREVPLDLIMRLNAVQNVSQLFEELIEGGTAAELKPIVPLGTRFGADDFDNIERKENVETPKNAGCEPELVTVSLRRDDSPLTFVYPSCTRVKRCGGCCNSDLLSCQPSQKEFKNFQVYISEYNGRNLAFKSKEIIEVEQHTKCTCDCKIKKEHCNVYQVYRRKDCRCRCNNPEDRQKCESDNSTKIWDNESCVCRCRNINECSTGFFFEENSCSCKPEPVLLSRFGGGEEVRRRRPSNGFNYQVTREVGEDKAAPQQTKTNRQPELVLEAESFDRQ